MDMIYGMDADLVGAELFGRSARLRLALWVLASESKFWQQQAADDMGIKTQYLKTELVHLQRLGMIETVERDDPVSVASSTAGSSTRCGA